MAPDRRELASRLYHAALERPPEGRDAYLQDACGGDESLRLEVESLLQYEERAAVFLERPAADTLGYAGQPGLMIGAEFGRYEIVSCIGAGGMGEVYRARDRKLGRDVAIKLLPHQFTSDTERRARFEREARVLATLRHPNISTIYGLEDFGDRSALILELVQGATLSDTLERGPLIVTDALAIARQIADALDAAHLHGIIHRDLKPSNIVLEDSPGAALAEARVKVLDFGLAKTISGAGGEQQDSAATPEPTEAGRILGTPAYMSPEQARGDPVDRRTDIWAFACVLFEMLTGRRPFDGGSSAATLARVLEHEPDWQALPAGTPSAIRAVLQRCLQKNPMKRLRDIADARFELEDTNVAGASTSDSDLSRAAFPRRSGYVRVLMAFIVGAVLAGAGLALMQRLSGASAVDSFEFESGPPPATTFPFQNFGFAVAPDGSQLVMVAFAENRLALWVRPLASAEFRRLRGTEGAHTPFWSPDSRQIAFFADGKLKTVELSGEAPSEVCDAAWGEAGVGGAWNREGVILLGSWAGPIRRVPVTDGVPSGATVRTRGETSHRWPSFLPDGRHFLFLAQGPGGSQLRLGSLASADSTPIGSIRSNAIYAAGHLLFVRGGLMAQRFDLRSRQLVGEPFPLNDGMRLMRGLGAFSASDTGLLGYSAGWPRSETRLIWRDRSGTEIEALGEPDSHFDLALSPDESRVAVSSEAQDGNIDILLIDPARGGNRERLTSDEGFEFHPAWSPEGREIAFTSNRNGLNNVFRRAADGSGQDVRLSPTNGRADQAVWSPDGKWILYVVRGEGLRLQSIGEQGDASLFVETAPFGAWNPTFSPRGDWLVYTSDRTGQFEVFGRPFPSGGPEHKISVHGGKIPRWRSDRELFFLALDGTLMSVRFDPAGNPPFAVPRSLFQTGLAPIPVWNHPYDVARNGQRFLIPVSREAAASRTITVVTNWTARLPDPATDGARRSGGR